MPIIRQHKNTDVLCIDNLICHGNSPGQTVCHKEDRYAYGIVVASDGVVCTVLWSKPPREIQAQQIVVTSRKLKTQWHSEMYQDSRDLLLPKDITNVNPDTPTF